MRLSLPQSGPRTRADHLDASEDTLVTTRHCNWTRSRFTTTVRFTKIQSYRFQAHFFRVSLEASNNKYVPRAVLVDLEPGTIDVSHSQSFARARQTSLMLISRLNIGSDMDRSFDRLRWEACSDPTTSFSVNLVSPILSDSRRVFANLTE